MRGGLSAWLVMIAVVLAGGHALADYEGLVEGPTGEAGAEGAGPGPGAVILSNVPADYDWWHGCSPTAAGMLMGWWDEAGYDVFPGDHRNLPATYPNSSSNQADYEDARGVVAGWAHAQAGGTYGTFAGHAPDSLADFMLTDNGDTMRSNMAHGFQTFAAWDDPRTVAIESQRFVADTKYTSSGWSFTDYCAEIDAGRPVHVGLSSSISGGHSVLGVGYNNTDGKQSIIVHTTWHSGLQEWEWANETVTGKSYSVYAGTYLDTLSLPTPELSAYVSIAHINIRELVVTLGIGDPSSPTWSTVVSSGQGGSADNLVITDIDCTDVLTDFTSGQVDWFLKVYDALTGKDGTIEDFQIRYEFDEMVYEWEGGPLDVPVRTDTYAYVTTTPMIPGDATGDGVVDEADASRLAECWGQGEATWRMGDFDGDDVVGMGDASILAANWGFTWDSALEGVAAAVPEPGVWVLLLGLAPLAMRRRRGTR